MRTLEIDGLVVYYPNDVMFAFSPAIFTVKNKRGNAITATMTIGINGESYTITRESYTEREVRFDVRRYLQMLLSKVSKVQNGALQFADVRSTFAERARVKLVVNGSTGGNGATTLNGTFLVVWGAQDAGEEIPRVEDIPYFANLPFSFGLFSIYPVTLEATSPYGGDYFYGSTGTDTDVHLFDIDLQKAFPALPVISEIFVRQISPYTERGNMFLADPTTPVVKRVHTIECSQGVYLRWLDRFGAWRYWLFQPQTETDADTVGFTYTQEARLSATVYVFGVNDAGGVRQVMTRKRTQLLAATNLEKWAIKYLSSLGQSPVVEVYRGQMDWQRVQINAQTRTIGDDALTDYTVTLILPQLNSIEG